MSQRFEFINLALQEGSNISELCRRFDISRKTGYKFIKRFKEDGIDGLADQSKRPKRSPNSTTKTTEKKILDLRDKHPVWGGRKLKKRLENMGYQDIPAPGTITQILKRHNRICNENSETIKPWKRFEAKMPNDLWQMDFKGYFQARDGRCHPLTILDDHSRFSLCVGACRNERTITVKDQLIIVFRRYGIPYIMIMDNGAPWGSDSKNRYTKLTVWLIRLGIKVIHSRPYHPQTMGKDERFHRTLKAEVINYCHNKTIDQCQVHFDDWRNIYNTQRPHEALNMKTPVDKYQISVKSYPEQLPSIEYGPDDIIRKVQQNGKVHFKNNEFKVSKAFYGQTVALRNYGDGQYFIYFCNQKIGHVDLTCN